MFIRLFASSAQTSARRYGRSNACGLESPHTRRLGVEPLEERALLAVASVPVEYVAYCVAAPIQNAPIEPISLDALKAEIESTTSETSNEIVFNLVEVSNAVIEEEADEDDSFIVDGKRFESYEALRVKHLVFPNDGSSDDSDDAGMNPRSGGSGGGEPETWDIEVTTSLSSIVSDLSGTYTNPLVEHRCGSGGATPLTNSDYVLVTLPGLPYGYISDVTISQGALARASFYIASDSYYSSLNSGFQYSGGSDCLVYVVPKNDTIVNGNAVVSLGISEPYIPGSGGFGIYDEYDFNLIATSASATILDDDRWLITVEASDPSATERLPDVEPDYGYYTFRREHEDPDIPGDTTYPVTIAFNTLEAPYSAYYCAQYGSNADYTLSTTPLDANDRRVYLSNFASQGTSTTYVNDGLVELHHRFIGEIPAEKFSADLRLQPGFDWDDEGDLWFGEEDVNPGDQLNEKVRLSIDNVSGFGGSDWEGIGDPSTAEIEIRDGAVVHLLTDEGISDGKQIDLRRNSDDDNDNDEIDFNESGEIADENDLQFVKICVAVDELLRTDGARYVISVYVNIFGTLFRAWENVTRLVPYLPDPNNPVPKFQVSATNPPYAEGANELVIEGGLDEGTGVISVEANAEIEPASGGGDNTPTDEGTSLTVTVQVTDKNVDIDIDSDNTTQGNSYPTRDDLEEELENDDFATGKIIVPSWEDRDNDGVRDCWERGVGTDSIIPTGKCYDFYPIVLQIPDDVPLDKTTISINYNMFTDIGGSNIPSTQGMGGDIRIWTKQGSASRKIWSVENEENRGDFVPTSAGLFNYEPSDLGFTDGCRTVTLYVEGVTENYQNTSDLAIEYGLPKTKISFAIKIDIEDEPTIVIKDEIKYIVASKGSFYYDLLFPELRAAYASQLIYGRNDGNAQALKLLQKSDLQDFSFNRIIKDWDIQVDENTHEDTYIFDDKSVSEVLTSQGNSIGYNIGLYREYVTGKYILSFAGTDPHSIEDWETDLQQAIGSADSSQYLLAKGLGYEFAFNEFFSSDNLIITGHSLGGGLASTAAVCASAIGMNFQTYTFNSAGTDFDRVVGQSFVFAEFESRYGVSSNDVQNSINLASQYIVAYYVDHDIVTILQRTGVCGVPTAIGRPCELDSEYDLYFWTGGLWGIGDSSKKCHEISVVISALQNYINEDLLNNNQ